MNGKKMLSFFIALLMILVSIPFAFTATAWDGTANSSFSGGSGTKEDPYKISDAGDLALLLFNLDFGVSDYAGVYFRITRDIYMNDEDCRFIPDTGLIKISDGKNVAFIGTGVKGDASGDNDLFDETASVGNYWYASDESTDKVHHYDRDTVYGGELYFSHSSYASDRKSFKGVIDGENHVISGVFSYLDGDAYADHNGLFFDAIGATVKNISIESSLFFGTATAGFAGYAEDSIFTNLDFDGIVIGDGGIVAEAVNCDFGECINRGYVFGTGNVGGIVGFNQASGGDNYIAYCDNEGSVLYQGDYSATGGVVGKNLKASIEYCENKGVVSGGKQYTGGIVGNNFGALVNECVNRGTVNGRTLVGGVVGMTDDSGAPNLITECTNYGVVSGESSVGGVVGYMNNVQEGVIDYCYNFCLVSGESIVGGIVGTVMSRGETEINSCRNEGFILSDATAGGIIGTVQGINGSVSISRCVNQNEVASVSKVGGIVGNISAVSGGVAIEKSYNSAPITGGINVGGIAGYYALPENAESMSIINCYNSGDINASENAGGIVGGVERTLGIGRALDIKTSYNVGEVVAKFSNGGGLLGYSNCQINITDCYFSDTASNSCGSANKLSDDSVALSAEEMTIASSFVGFDFQSVWEIGRYANYDYPTIIGLSHYAHAHNYFSNRDETHHWEECKCGSVKNKEEHIPELQDRGNGFSDKVCTICGAFLGVVENETVPAKIGDVNNDGVINQYDYILVKRHYFETRKLTSDELTRADVNKDDKVDQYDYILICRHYFGTYVIG